MLTSRTKPHVVALILCFAAIASAGCKHELNIPKPAATHPQPPAFDEISTVRMNARVNLGQAVDAVHAAIPRVVAEDPGMVCNQFGVYRAPGFDPVTRPTITAQQDTITATLPLVFRAGRRCFPTLSCGYDSDPIKRLNVVTSVKLTWNPAWRIDVDPQTRFDLLDACNISALGIDATGFVREKASGKADDVSKRVRDLLSAAGNLRPKMDLAWPRMNAPLKIAEDTWLVIRPLSLMTSPLNGQGSFVDLTIAMTARPQVVYSTTAPNIDVPGLPLLQTGTPGGGFHVAVEAVASFASVSPLLKKKLVGQTIILPSNKRVRIREVEMFGSGNSVIVSVNVDGFAKGTVYFAGTPLYLPVGPSGEPDVIQIQNFDFTVDTRNILVKTANWLMHERFVTMIKEQLTFPLDRPLTTLRQQLTQAMNQDLGNGVRLQGSLSSARVAGLWTDALGIRARVIADGTLDLSVP